MRKFIYIIGLTALSLTACNTFLDVQPVDRILETSVFKDQKSIHTALNGVYLRMAKPELYGGKMTMQTVDVLGQYYNIGSAHRYTQLFNFKYSELEVQNEFETIWKNSYNTLLNINNFIDKINQTEAVIALEEKSILLGEAIGLRAFVHFDMLRLFGPIYSQNPDREAIPYVEEATAKTQQLLPASQVVERILRDIDESTRLLNEDPIRSQGVEEFLDGSTDNFFRMRNRRFNYYALKAFQARVQLYVGENQSAYTTAKEIIDEVEEYFPWTNPNDVVSNPNSPDRVFSSEILFGIENDQLYKQYDLSFNPVLTSNEILVPSKAALDNIYEFNTSDYRYFSWVTPTIGNYEKVLAKFQDVQNRNKSFRYLQPLIRKSELYLILAEATSDDNQALTYINALRNNRGLVSLEQISDRRTSIDTEFRKEFYGEGQLFFYNKRLAKTSVPNPANNSIKSIDVTSYIIPLPLSETNNR